MKDDSRSGWMKTDWFKPDYIDREPPQNENRPAGPFRQSGEGPRCSLLIFVPRNLKSFLIDATTGRYGYSHLAIDCGELDISSGKHVMIESTVGLGVHYSFQDEYGARNFVRIPLDEVLGNRVDFCNCIRSKVGDKFDMEEALTLGLFYNPAKLICSDLATLCLPEAMRMDIARCHKAGSLHSRSAIRTYSGPSQTPRLFVSPNGFAEYFGAPRGEKLQSPDQLSKPLLRVF